MPSYGEYYDKQNERLRKMLSNKDRKEWLEWEERYNKEKTALSARYQWITSRETHRWSNMG